MRGRKLHVRLQTVRGIAHGLNSRLPLRQKLRQKLSVFVVPEIPGIPIAVIHRERREILCPHTVYDRVTVTRLH